MTLELHIQEVAQSAYQGMLWSHPMITNDPNQQLEVMGLPDAIWVPYWRPCFVCGEDTTWIDLSFEAPVHPGRCSERGWDDYAWANMWSTIKNGDWRKDLAWPD